MSIVAVHHRRPGRTAALLGAAAVFATAAVAVTAAARRAEADNPPLGRFVEVDGVRLHVVERGSGPDLVLIHGNGSMVEDFLSSPLVEAAAEHYRVVLVDRPGYGHSDRPRDRWWAPELQADLFVRLFDRLGLENPIVLGHSWGALVAAAIAIRHPDRIRSVVLVGGYYFPTPRADLALFSTPAIPVLGTAIRHTVAPLVARAIWPRLMARIFGPREEPESFRRGFPMEMALRPSQLRAAAAESAMMIPAAIRLSERYAGIRVPVVILAGRHDRMVDTATQSKRLAGVVPGARYNDVEGVGHMIHHSKPAAVLAAIELAG